MITITACMIVKNEENVLGRCLDSLKNLVDEIVIVDTGSTDRTKEIAKQYTDKIYDFTWIHDFAAARNFSFSKATMDYIYVADADEEIDEENQEKFRNLKEAMIPEVELVQMYYTNQLEYGTTYNYDKEYRPKLYKRLREFTWQDPIHETVTLDPVIYDSDIEIIHRPAMSHAKRDFNNFYVVLDKGERLSPKLVHMFAKELFIAGDEEDFIKAGAYFEEWQRDTTITPEECAYIQCVLAKCARIQGNLELLMKVALKNIASKASAEVCYELGEHYLELGEYEEALIWYYNAAYETECQLNIHYGGDYPLKRLADCYRALGNVEQTSAYEELAEKWSL
ncbi:tetratricopeptide repeat-containing glycosyltransferase family 2 protein [Anaerosporobacter sp.]|uniref:tetratricopeptide repeat-containing glycosyltransferase family 2 protein n=1 Tax=Anaerosporobacter sp. TaxID=1872529 RepID=UPI00286F04E5|nr:glycosyltransferase family 2 protein [Anaerosporobacter sp.]